MFEIRNCTKQRIIEEAIKIIYQMLNRVCRGCIVVIAEGKENVDLTRRNGLILSAFRLDKKVNTARQIFHKYKTFITKRKL